MHVYMSFLLPVGFLPFVQACFPLYSSKSSVHVQSRALKHLKKKKKFCIPA